MHKSDNEPCPHLTDNYEVGSGNVVCGPCREKRRDARMAIDKETKEVDTLESLRIKNKKLKKKLKSLDLRVSELENIIKQKFETPQEYKPLKIAKRIPVSVRNKTKRDEELEKARRESTSR